jgi:uncharacterized protein (TIGR03067 family)
MKIRAFAIFAIGLLLAADQPAHDAVQAELKKLQGEWQPVSFERDGKKLPTADFDDERVIIKGDQLTVTKRGKVMQRATLTVDPTANPKTFVKTVTDGINKGKKYHAIYELEADTWRECKIITDKDLPKEFTSRNGASLEVSKRVRP